MTVAPASCMAYSDARMLTVCHAGTEGQVFHLEPDTWAGCWLCYFGKSHNFWRLLSFLFERKCVQELMYWFFLDLDPHSLFIFPNPWVKWRETFEWHPQNTLLGQNLLHSLSFSIPTASTILMASNSLSLDPLSWALNLYYFQLEIFAWKFHRNPQTYSVQYQTHCFHQSLFNSSYIYWVHTLRRHWTSPWNAK